MKNCFYKDKEWLYKKYCEEKMSVIDIAKLCEVSKPTVYKWIRQFKLAREYVLPKRSSSRYSLNEKYFENIDNGNKAYWLGFIAADGCVVDKKGHRHLYIELAERDRCHLEAFKKEIEFNGPIYDMKARGRSKPSCKLQISSSRMVLDLVKLGITSNKTHTLNAPDIDSKFYHHWIRGVFDGDGSISLRKSGHHGGEFFGTKSVIDFITSNIPGSNKVSKKKKCKGFYHSFSGKKIIEKIYDYLYCDSNVALSRKEDKFKIAISS